MASGQPGRPMAWGLPSQEVTECLRASRMCETSGSTDPAGLAPFGEEEGDESVKLWEAGHKENECRNFSSGRRSVINTELDGALV